MPKYRVVKIKRINKHYLDILHVLDIQCFPNDERYEISDRDDWWIIYYGNLPVAFGGIRFYKRKAFLCRVGVIKTHRGKGLQKKLIKLRIDYARRNGLKKIVTYTSLSNYASANSLINNGFKLYRYKKYGLHIFVWWKLIF